jgi:hypothetical protein
MFDTGSHFFSCQARARSMHWNEEVQLLYEEMRCVLTLLEWQASWWFGQAGKESWVSPTHAEGLQAYGHRQASVQQALLASFKVKWCQVNECISAGKGMSDAEADAQDVDIDSDDKTV